MTTTILTLAISIVILSPTTIIPNVLAEETGTKIFNHVATQKPQHLSVIPFSKLKIDPNMQVIPPGPFREVGNTKPHDEKMCRTYEGQSPDQVKCIIVPGFSSVNSWSEGPGFYPPGSGYSTYNGIGSSPQVISLGGTSLSTPVTYLVETLNLIDTSGHKWGLQNTLGWGTNSNCGGNGYAEEFWLFDITNNIPYVHTTCLSGSIVGNQYVMTIFYNSATSQWNYKIADGTVHSITEIAGVPAGSLSAVDSTTSAASETQYPILLESADTTASDFSNFEMDMYGSEITQNGGSTWILAGSGSTVNIPAFSTYNDATNPASSLQSLHIDITVGGNLPAPTTVGFEGATENGILGPGISFSKSGYDNYWICPVQCGSPPPVVVQPANPGAGYGHYDGYSLW